MHGCKTWSVIEDKTRLNTRERKFLGKVFGPITERGVWEIRTNEQLGQIYKIIYIMLYDTFMYIIELNYIKSLVWQQTLNQTGWNGSGMRLE
jgi:hypothetical protein